MTKKYWFAAYSIVLGFLLFCLLVLFRIFRNKEEINFNLIIDNVSNWQLFLFIAFCIFQFSSLLGLIYFLYKKYRDIQKTSKVILFINSFLQKFYVDPLEFIFQKFANFFPGIIFILVTEFINKDKTDFREKIYLYLYIILSYLPQVVVACVFFFEICFLEKLHLFFFAIILLLIPLIFDLYIKFKLTFVERSFPDFYEYLNIESFEDETNRSLRFSFKESYTNQTDELLQYLSKNFIMLKSMERQTRELKKRKELYYPLVLLVTTTLYFIGSLYRLQIFFYN